MNGPALEMRRIVKRYGSVPALDGFDLSVNAGELLSLVGPSGCGKSTALFIVAGLIAPDGGELSLFGRSLMGVLPRDRDVGMVFQENTLYPHLTVAQNLAFPIKARGKSGRRAIVRMARRLHIEHLLDRYPASISGGEAQRVALGRALIRKPKLFLLDEPLSGLDGPLRERLRGLIRDLVRESGVTTIFVTHDQAEALAMGDRVAVMGTGRLLQSGTPREIYERPLTAVVARFFGTPPMNLLPGRISGGEVSGPWGNLRVEDAGLVHDVLAGFRPEHCRVAPAASDLSGRVSRVDFFGHDIIVTVVLSEELEVRLRLSAGGDVPEVGGEVGLVVDPADVVLFDAETEERL